MNDRIIPSSHEYDIRFVCCIRRNERISPKKWNIEHSWQERNLLCERNVKGANIKRWHKCRKRSHQWAPVHLVRGGNGRNQSNHEHRFSREYNYANSIEHWLSVCLSKCESSQKRSENEWGKSNKHFGHFSHVHTTHTYQPTVTTILHNADERESNRRTYSWLGRNFRVASVI